LPERQNKSIIGEVS